MSRSILSLSSSIFAFFLISILCVGCTTSNRLATASGKPEVFLKRVEKEKARETLTQMLTSDQMVLTGQTPSTLTFEKKRSDKFWNYRKEEYKFTFWSHEDGTKVFASGRYAYDQDEKKYPMKEMENEHDLNRMQAILNRLKAKLRG